MRCAEAHATDLKITRPLAVVDCNFIQRCQGADDDVPCAWDCLLTGSVFLELASKDGKERDFLFAKFTNWTRRNADRLWLARDFNDLHRAMEPRYDAVRQIRVWHLIAKKETTELRRYAKDKATNWTAPLENEGVQKWLVHASNSRNSFVEFTGEARDVVQAQPGRPSEKIPHTPQAIRHFVRSYDISKLIVHRDKYAFYGDWRWRRLLSAFPDKLLIARTARLDLYYAIRRALGDSKKFENNWDDKHYALCASYTGHLVTHDAGLRTAAEIIAPGIRLFPRDAKEVQQGALCS
jgi:hypothetical protein